jgi:Raf kinase inhibitor-like YbhB/YbcL family protein
MIEHIFNSDVLPYVALLFLGAAVARTVESFVLSSGAFKEGQSIPTVHANTGVAGGKNISPSLSWSRPPQNAKSMALLCLDRHPIANNWMHWLVINIPITAIMLPEGASHTGKMPSGAKELQNSFGTMGWGGPQPPRSSGKHQYEFILYALTVESLRLNAGVTLAAFNQAIEGKVVDSAKLVGTFER